MQELAENIKWLREQYSHGGMINLPEITTINALVDLVAEIHNSLQQCDEAMGYMSEYDIPLCLPDKVKDSVAKSKAIAELASKYD